MNIKIDKEKRFATKSPATVVMWLHLLTISRLFEFAFLPPVFICVLLFGYFYLVEECSK